MKSNVLFAIVVVGLCSLAEAEKSDYVPVYPYGGSGRYILTSEPGANARIDGASVFGVRPGSPFLYAIPASGERPMTFAVATPGMTVYKEGGHEIIVKELSDGSKAIGLFNKNETEEVVTLDWELAGLSGATARCSSAMSGGTRTSAASRAVSPPPSALMGRC